MVALVILALVVWGFYILYNQHRSPAYQTVTTNKDTGQTIISDPNQAPENFGGGSYVTILGANKLLNVGMNQAEFTLAENLITSYINRQLKRQYTQVAILNDGFTISGTTISAKMRLGTSDKLLNLKITFRQLQYVQVKISDPAGNSHYSYDSGVQQTPPPSQ